MQKNVGISEYYIITFNRLDPNGLKSMGQNTKLDVFSRWGTHNEEPEYAEVKKILVQRDLTSIRFLTSTCITSCWNDHFQAYEVKKRPQQINFELVKHCQLSYFLPLHMVKPSGHHTMMKCIVPRYEIGK